MLKKDQAERSNQVLTEKDINNILRLIEDRANYVTDVQRRYNQELKSSGTIPKDTAEAYRNRIFEYQKIKDDLKDLTAKLVYILTGNKS